MLKIVSINYSDTPDNYQVLGKSSGLTRGFYNMLDI